MNIPISQDKFQDFLIELCKSDDFRYKFLRHEVTQALQGKTFFYDKSILNIQGDSWILIIHSSALLIYGENWNNEQFIELEKVFDLTKFSNYLLVGESLLINALLEYYNIENYQLEMQRLFYRAKAINIFTDNNLEIYAPTENDVEILAKMLQQYYHEEYEGENDKGIEEMSKRVNTCISEKTIYLLKNEKNDILSFCTIINPDIGILFTNGKFRNKGYGKIILSHCADLLLKRNNEIYLMTVKSNAESNSVCYKVGFKPYFEYSYVRINSN